jgi:hypothetical protein
LQVGDTIRITFEFQNIPGFSPDSSDIASAFLEYCDLQIQTSGETGASWTVIGATQWQIVGTMQDNCTAGATKAQVWNAMNAVSANQWGPIMNLQVDQLEIALGSPSAPNTGFVQAVETPDSTTPNPNGGGSFFGFTTTAALFAIALIVLGFAYVVPFFTTRKSI